MLLLWIGTRYGEVDVPGTTFAFTFPSPAVQSGKNVVVPLSTWAFTFPTPLVGTGEIVNLGLTTFVFSFPAPVIGVGKSVSMPVTEIAFSFPIQYLRVGDITWLTVRVIQDLFDEFEFVLGYELAGGIEFMPDTFLRDDNSVEGATIEDIPDSSGPEWQTEVGAYVYTSPH